MWLSGLSYNKDTTTTTNNANTNGTQQQQQQRSMPNSVASFTTTTTTTIPLFVLYAHRRWFHREMMDLLWNRLGRHLLTGYGEVNALTSDVYQQRQMQYYRFVWRRLVQRNRQLRKRLLVCISSAAAAWNNKKIRFYFSRRIKSSAAGENEENHDDEDDGIESLSTTTTTMANDSDSNYNYNYNYNKSCPICDTNEIAVPYRLVDCCGSVACYTCLWEYVATATATTKLQSSVAMAMTVPCPVCYQDSQRCRPV